MIQKYFDIKSIQFVYLISKILLYEQRHLLSNLYDTFDEVAQLQLVPKNATKTQNVMIRRIEEKNKQKIEN